MATKKRRAAFKKAPNQQVSLQGSLSNSTAMGFIGVSLLAIFMLPLLFIGGQFLYLAVTLFESIPSAPIPFAINMSIEIGMWLVGLSFIGLWVYVIWSHGVSL